MGKKIRKIVYIDEDKCNGCGLCIPNCHEGALEIIDGKARLVADNLCDGLGDCLGECPQGAISILERPADDYEQKSEEAPETRERSLPCSGSCPGLRPSILKTSATARTVKEDKLTGKTNSELSHWPVQLQLVPIEASFFKKVHLLIAADCVPFAYPDFHRKILQGKALVITCPKLDDTGSYIKKLALIIGRNEIKAVTVAHMEVGCCTALVRIVRKAVEISGYEVTINAIIVGIRGEAVATL